MFALEVGGPIGTRTYGICKVTDCLGVHIFSGQGPGNNTTKPGVLVVVGLTPAPEDEQDLNDWYRDEHINLLSKVCRPSSDGIRRL